MAKVNLDALIKREDFEIAEDINASKKKEAISIEDIKADSFFFTYLRKPDFQRETNEWDSEKVCELIKSFVEGDLIPAIILWRSKAGYLFVIDGSHRISALSAWVNDDYGDGNISKQYFAYDIPAEQTKIAQDTRTRVNKSVGSYQDFLKANSDPNLVRPEIVKYAKNLGALAIQLQWVEGDVSKAESSFFKINQQAAPIDKTEIILIETRKQPNSIATRAINRTKGHKYWSSFSQTVQDEVQNLASEINKLLFEPNLQTPVKTLDVPMCGKLYSNQTLQMVWDFVNLVIESEQNISLRDDDSGETTIKTLKLVKEITSLLNSNHPSSLGLHPLVYFYSPEGRFKIASFLAMVYFIIDLKKRKKTNEFIEVRSKFEKFIFDHDYLVQQINRKYRATQNSYKPISRFFQQVIVALKENSTDEEVIRKIRTNSEFKYLTTIEEPDKPEHSRSDFDRDTKSEIFIREALPNAPRCQICGGYIHKHSISIDHIQRKQDGGDGNVNNGQLAHPYCNTTYKN